MVTMVIAEQDHQPIFSSYMMSFSSQAEKQRFSSFAPLSADSATTIHGASAKKQFLHAPSTEVPYNNVNSEIDACIIIIALSCSPN